MKHFITFLFLFFTVALQSQTLEEFIDVAIQNSYQVAIDSAEYRIAKEKMNEVGAYEHTEVAVGVFVSTPQTYVGEQVLYVGLSQDLPWFGTKEATKNVQKAKANAKAFDIALTKKELIYQVKTAYYELYQKQMLSLIYEDNKEILSRYEDMAMAALESSSATMNDVMKIVIQKNELHSKMFQNINSIEYLTRNFNRILQRPADTPLYITDSLDVLNLFYSKKSIESHPIVEKINANKAIYESELEVIKKNKAPKINLGIDYILINENPNFKSASNGNDIWMPKLTIALPLFNGGHFSSLENQLILKEKIIKDEIEDKKNLLNTELDKANLLLENAILMVVAAQKNQEEIQRSINLMTNSIETGLLKYEKVLELQLQIIKYQILELNAVTEAYMAKAKIEYLTE